MTAVATLARSSIARLIEAGTLGLGVRVTDFDPDSGQALAPCAVTIAHDQRERFVDRYVVRVELDPSAHTAQQLSDRVEQVTETVDQALQTGLPASWLMSPWSMGFERDAQLFVASTQLRLPTEDPTPDAFVSPTIGPLTMTVARTTITAAITAALEGFHLPVNVYGYTTWPGGAMAPVAVVVSPLGLDRDHTFHQVALLISGVVPGDQAQDWLDDLIWQLDDGLRDILPASYFLAGLGDTETGWDRVGWLNDGDMQLWAAQVAVAHYR